MILELDQEKARCTADAQLEKFDARYNKRLHECAGISERIAQLATSHPLAFFALATRYGPLKYRKQAVQLAVDGAPLAEVCAALGIPISLRRLGPQSFRRLLPPVRWSTEANKRLAPHIPTDPTMAAVWLPRINTAHQLCDEEFALWCASQSDLYNRRPLSNNAMRILALYAWNSRFSPLPFGKHTVPKWNPDMGLESAITKCAAWSQQIRLLCDLGPEGLADTWLPSFKSSKYEIIPIVTPELLIEEATAMQNCVASYSYCIAQGECRLFSMRVSGSHAATIEIRYCRARATYSITQMKGPLNSAYPQDLARIANRWLIDHAPSFGPERHPEPADRELRLRALLAPYFSNHDLNARTAATFTLRNIFNGVGELCRLKGRFRIARRVLT